MSEAYHKKEEVLKEKVKLDQNSYLYFLPKNSISKIQSWVDELNVVVNLKKPRITKLGDFRLRNGKMYITINNNLNIYSFLITITHELAHAFVYREYKNISSPHGEEWKYVFKSMMLNFISPEYFPYDVLNALSLHIINPRASTLSDFKLSNALRGYNAVNDLVVLDIDEGEKFIFNNGNIFLKGKRIRKRYKCIEISTNKQYLFHPLTNVSRIK